MNFLSAALSFVANNPAVLDFTLSALAKAAPALSPALSGLAKSFLATAPVDPATNKPVATTNNPTDAVTILQQLINLAQTFAIPSASPVKVDGLWGPETHEHAKALLALGGITI